MDSKWKGKTMNDKNRVKETTAPPQNQTSEGERETPEPPHQMKVFPKKELERLTLPSHANQACAQAQAPQSSGTQRAVCRIFVFLSILSNQEQTPYTFLL